MANIKEARVKVCLLGSPGVGKTSLINRFVSNLFGEKYLSTIGTKISKKVVNIPNPRPKKKSFLSFKKPIDIYRYDMNIWDIAGQKTWIKIQKTYYQGSKGALVVCDMTRRETLDNLITTIEDLEQAAGPIPLVYLMNKSDLTGQAQFSASDLAKVAVPRGFPYFSTSAKTGTNVENAFLELGKLMALEMQK